MTIASQTSKVIYVGTGSTAATTFAYPFKINVEADLLVEEYAVSTSAFTTKVLNSDYAVTNAGVDAGGNVLLTGTYTSVPSGSNLIIRRVVDITQETDWVENDPFSAEVLEDRFDYQTMIDQQLQEQIDRAVAADASQWSANATYANLGSYSVAAVAAAEAAASAATVAVDAAATVPSPVGQTAGYTIAVNGTSDGWVFTSSGSASVNRQAFYSTSLSAGVLDITHGSTLTKPYVMSVQVFDSAGYMVVPDNVIVSASTLHIALSTASYTVTGTWGVAYIA